MFEPGQEMNIYFWEKTTGNIDKFMVRLFYWEWISAMRLEAGMSWAMDQRHIFIHDIIEIVICINANRIIFAVDIWIFNCVYMYAVCLCREYIQNGHPFLAIVFKLLYACIYVYRFGAVKNCIGDKRQKKNKRRGWNKYVWVGLRVGRIKTTCRIWWQKNNLVAGQFCCPVVNLCVCSGTTCCLRVQSRSASKRMYDAHRSVAIILESNSRIKKWMSKRSKNGLSE